MSRRWWNYRGAIACFVLFAIVSVLVESGATGALDRQLLIDIAAGRSPGMTWCMRRMSQVGNAVGELPFIAVAVLVLRMHHRSGEAIRFVMVAASGEVFYALTKLVFHRPRPTVVTHLSGAGWFSYPSGHAMLAPIIWGFGLVLIAESLRSRLLQRMLWTLAVLITAMIAVSRVYLGVHYPSDVLGALCLGTGWVLLWRDRVSPSKRSATSAAPATR